MLIDYIGRSSSIVQSAKPSERIVVLWVLLLRDYVQHIQNSHGLRIHGQQDESRVHVPQEEAVESVLVPG